MRCFPEKFTAEIFFTRLLVATNINSEYNTYKLQKYNFPFLFQSQGWSGVLKTGSGQAGCLAGRMSFATGCIIVSSVRSSNSHPDLLLLHPPTFSDLACLPLYNNIGLSLSGPLKLYQKQSLDSSADYMYTSCVYLIV